MMSKIINIYVNPEVTPGDTQGKIASILHKIANARESIEKLRDQNMDLERARDQYIIHLQQCQEDHNILKQIYKKLKFRFDSHNGEQLDDSINLHASIPFNAPIDPQIKQAFTQLPTLETIQIAPAINEYSQSPKLNVRLRYAISTSSVICTAQFSNSGKLCAFADGKFVYVINYEDGDISFAIPLPTAPDVQHTRALKFSPDDKYIAVSSFNSDILLYETRTQRFVHKFEGHAKEVNSIIFNQARSWMISAGFDGLIAVWDMNTFQLVKKIEQPNNGQDKTIVGIAPSLDYSFYAVAFVNGTVGIYDELFVQPMIQFPTHQTTLMGVNISPIDDTIVTPSGDNSIKLWTLRAVAIMKAELIGHTNVVITAKFAPNYNLLFSGSRDMMVRIWNQKTGHPIVAIAAHKNTVFQIDHHPTLPSFISCSGDGVICVWDYDEPQQ